MKKLALISSYCNDDNKLNILKKNIQVLKSLDLDVFVISPIKIDVDCNFFFQTYENPILNWPDKAISLWRTIPYEDKTIKLQPILKDTGWASLYQIKKMMEFASTYEYDLFYLLIYDLEIDDVLISDIKNNVSNTTYPRQDFNNPKIIFKSSFHFSIFDKEKLIEMSNLIRLEQYKNEDGFAEDFIVKWTKQINMNVSNHVVKDLVHIELGDVFDLSIDKNYKFFINKEQNKKFKIFIYDFHKPIDLKINENFLRITKNPTFVEFPLNCEEIKTISLKCENNEINYSHFYNEITRNILEVI
jgi:hypothetical protein